MLTSIKILKASEKFQSPYLSSAQILPFSKNLDSFG